MSEFIYPGTSINNDENIVLIIREGIKGREGHCPCIPKHLHTEDTLCPCKLYRDSGKCKCRLYVNKEEEWTSEITEELELT